MTKDYGMFSDHGNNAIGLIIQLAQKHDFTWREVYAELQELSLRDGFEEAMDTEVREIVYDTLNFTDDFYISSEVESDGQPDEYTEWMDFDADC